MDVFFGAGVASHPTIIEQINYLLFMRALSQNDDDLRKIGVTDSNQLVFDGDLEKYRWDNLLTLNAEQLFIALEECLRKIPESTTNKTVRLVFRNAHIKLFDKPTLRTVLHEIDAFAKLMDDSEHNGKRDIFGDTYEYLLSKLAQAGTSGQFRTPRHIIEFLVDAVAPKKGETILDPAVGTAGFLVKSFEYLRTEYTSPEQLASGGAFDKLNSKEHTFLYEHTFSGFDSDEDMIKFGMMNLYLHGLQNARLSRQNTLTDTAGNRDKYDVILANPPFSGKIDKDSVVEELQIGTAATELLFLRYMMRHITDNGRVGVIIPDGVLFGNTGAHLTVRKQLLEAHSLKAVISLPPGVFLPYADASTSILIFQKGPATKEVWFRSISNDGFTLDDKRSPIAGSELNEVLDEYWLRKDRLGITVDIEDIKKSEYSLMEGDYISNFLDSVEELPPGWKINQLSEIIEEVTNKGSDGNTPVYSITKHDGFVRSSQYFTKQTHSKDLARYKIVKRNEFAYSAIHLDEGSIGLLLDEDAVLISPMYKVFRIRESMKDVINPVYLYRMLKSDDYLSIYQNIGKGSIKRRKSISYAQFSDLKIVLPTKPEQDKVEDQFREILETDTKLKTMKIDLGRSLRSIIEQLQK